MADIPRRTAAATRSIQRDVVYAAWSIPVTAVLPLLPAGTVLETLSPEGLRGSEGTTPTATTDGPAETDVPMTWVLFWCSLRSAARWAPLPETWGESYRHAELRVPILWNDKHAFHVLRSYVGHPTLAQALYPFATPVSEGRFDVFVDGNPAIGDVETVQIAVATDTPRIRLHVKRAPETLAPGAMPLDVAATAIPHLHRPRLAPKQPIAHQVELDPGPWQPLIVEDCLFADLPAPYDRPGSILSAGYRYAIGTTTWPARGKASHPKS